MKKTASASKSSSPNLGTKRTCPKCATKFYDFNKEQIVCPKCSEVIDPEALNPLAHLSLEAKKPAKEEKIEGGAEGDEVVAEDADILGNVEEIDDDEDIEDEVEIAGDDDEKESF